MRRMGRIVKNGKAMNTEMLRCLPVVFSTLSAGCASNADLPLIFGSSNTIGISIGGSLPEQGGDFTIGYKGRDFAIVPVTLVQPDGTEQQIGGELRGDKFRDAFSVLGQFESSASRSSTGTKTGLGKFFATGVAAKKLSDGFAKRLGDGRTAVAECANPTSTGTTQAASQHGGQLQQKQQQPQQGRTQQVQQQQQTAAASQRTGALMLFGQYVALGFNIGGSATQQGLDLTLGLKDRNFAIVPVILREGNGEGHMIRSKVSNVDNRWPDPTDRDSLSVLGQFQFDSTQGSGTTEAGLGKFFSTGVAAQRLSDGFKTRLCEEYKPVTQTKAQE